MRQVPGRRGGAGCKGSGAAGNRSPPPQSDRAACRGRQDAGSVSACFSATGGLEQGLHPPLGICVDDLFDKLNDVGDNNETLLATTMMDVPSWTLLLPACASSAMAKSPEAAGQRQQLSWVSPELLPRPRHTKASRVSWWGHTILRLAETSAGSVGMTCSPRSLRSCTPQPRPKTGAAQRTLRPVPNHACQEWTWRCALSAGEGQATAVTCPPPRRPAFSRSGRCMCRQAEGEERHRD